jgi:hypothetical protein
MIRRRDFRAGESPMFQLQLQAAHSEILWLTPDSRIRACPVDFDIRRSTKC